jgi:hypothetical protein
MSPVPQTYKALSKWRGLAGEEGKKGKEGEGGRRKDSKEEKLLAKLNKN